MDNAGIVDLVVRRSLEALFSGGIAFESTIQFPEQDQSIKVVSVHAYESKLLVGDIEVLKVQINPPFYPGGDRQLTFEVVPVVDVRLSSAGVDLVLMVLNMLYSVLKLGEQQFRRVSNGVELVADDERYELLGVRRYLYQHGVLNLIKLKE